MALNCRNTCGVFAKDSYVACWDRMPLLYRLRHQHLPVFDESKLKRIFLLPLSFAPRGAAQLVERPSKGPSLVKLN